MTNLPVARDRRPGRALALVLVLTALVTVAACSSDSSTTGTGTSTSGTAGTTGTTNVADNSPTDPFYIAPDPLPDGEPGDIIRSEPLAGAPTGSQAWKVLYRSTGIDGQPIAVSGVIIAPTATTTSGSTPGSAPSGTAVEAGRPIVSWAHPTTGVVDDCAPSTMTEVFALIPGLSEFLAAGYVVAATDYEGLGTAGIHPYLVGESEGRSVLDAARAARDLPEAGAGDQLLLWGHSQGGQASLFAGQLAPSYAPDLTLVATAAAAPAGELQELLNDDAPTPTGVILGAYAINAYLGLFGPQNPTMELSQVVTAAGAPAVDQIAELCNLTQDAQVVAIATPQAGKFYVDDPGSVEPWQTLLNENTAGQTTIDSPLFIAQGDADTVVIPATTSELAKAYCGLGVNVTEKVYPGVTHELIGFASAADVATWMGEVLAGNTPAGTCPSP